VTNPLPTDRSAATGEGVVPRPVLLAQLPRVGSLSRQTHWKIRRDGPEQFHNLHTAAHSESPSAKASVTNVDRDELKSEQFQARHYLDQTHENRCTPELLDGEGKPDHQRSPGLGHKLSQWDAQIAPYAGVIVTMALVASAGLLYWLIAGGPHGESEFQQSANWSYESQSEDSLPQPNVSVESLAQDDEAESSLFSWQREETASTPEHETHSELSQTEPPPAPEEEEGPEQYPQTSQPQELDFSKLESSDRAAKEAHLEPLPDVSELPTAASSAPINR